MAAYPRDVNKTRGFAVMDQQRRREVAASGGRIAHELGCAHEFTSEEAQAAGRLKWQKNPLSREEMARRGRNGAAARIANLRERAAQQEAGRDG